MKPGRSLLLRLPPSRGLTAPDPTLGDLPQIAQLPPSTTTMRGLSPAGCPAGPGTSRPHPQGAATVWKGQVGAGRPGSSADTMPTPARANTRGDRQRQPGSGKRPARHRGLWQENDSVREACREAGCSRYFPHQPFSRSHRAGEARSALTAPHSLPRGRASIPRNTVT